MKGEIFMPFEMFKGAEKNSEKKIINYKEMLAEVKECEILRHWDRYLSSPFLQQHTGSVSVPYSVEVQEMHVFLESYSMIALLYFAWLCYVHFLILKKISKMASYTLHILSVHNPTLEMQAKSEDDGKWSRCLLNLTDNALPELNFALWVNINFVL